MKNNWSSSQRRERNIKLMKSGQLPPRAARRGSRPTGGKGHYSRRLASLDPSLKIRGKGSKKKPPRGSNRSSARSVPNNPKRQKAKKRFRTQEVKAE